ncbi:unnamed protein product [Eretmochelys imbricata]
MSNGLHTQSSLLIPSDSSWQGDPYQCDVTHQGTGKTVSGKFPQELCGSAMPPQVHLLVPTCEDSATESQLELVCLLLSFRPGKANVKWLVNGKERSPPTPAFSSAMGTDGSYMGQSRMTVTRQSWERGDVYSCQVTHPAVGTELSMHNASKCLGSISKKEPTVTVSRAYHKDISGNSVSFTLICEASAFYPEEISMSWLKNNSPELKSSYSGPVSGNGTFSAYSILKVEQSQGEGHYICVVHHPAMEEPKRVVEKVSLGVSNCN